MNKYVGSYQMFKTSLQHEDLVVAALYFCSWLRSEGGARDMLSVTYCHLAPPKRRSRKLGVTT